MSETRDYGELVERVREACVYAVKYGEPCDSDPGVCRNCEAAAAISALQERAEAAEWERDSYAGKWRIAQDRWTDASSRLAAAEQRIAEMEAELSDYKNEVSVICRNCGVLVGGVEAGARARWTTCPECTLLTKETPQ